MKNRLIRLYILTLLIAHEDSQEYIEEKSKLYLGNYIGEEIANIIIEYHLKSIHHRKNNDIGRDATFTSMYVTPLINYLQLKIGNDGISKLNNESYIIGGKIIGVHPNLSKPIISGIGIFLNTKFFKYKFRELRLYEIRQKTNIG